MPADLVFLNGPIFTANAARTFVRAVAVEGERLVAIGTESEVSEHIGPGTVVVDLAGRLMTPGFQDAHVHPATSGLDLLRCSFQGCRSAEDAVRFVAEYAAVNPDRAWILGGGWSQDWFDRGCPPKELLDAVVPSRPVLVYNADGHGAWVNTRALELAGVDASTPDPPDGRLERNPDGSPQGTLHEGAVALVTRVAPKDTPDDLRRGLLLGQAYLVSKGVTAWQDAHVDAAVHDVYRSLAESGELQATVTGALWWDRHYGLDQIERLETMRAESVGRYRPVSVKLLLDGVMENHTASLLEPYLDGESGNRGIDFIAPGELKDIVTALDAHGFSCHFHAIGDAAVRSALDAVEGARTANGWTPNRHHIAHLQLVHPDDIPRFRRLGVTANAQPLWACDGGYQTDLTKPFLGPERSEWQYPFGSLLRAGTMMAMGSDWGVSTADVMAQIDVAVTRLNPDEPEQPPLNPTERITLLDALAAFTAGSAYVNHREGHSGTIRPGKLADLVVLDRDPFERGPIREAGVAMTIIGGRVVHEEV